MQENTVITATALSYSSEGSFFITKNFCVGNIIYYYYYTYAYLTCALKLIDYLICLKLRFNVNILISLIYPVTYNDPDDNFIND